MVGVNRERRNMPCHPYIQDLPLRETTLHIGIIIQEKMYLGINYIKIICYTVPSEGNFLPPECYVPAAVDITVIPTYFLNGTVAVNLNWKLSKNENKNIDFCNYSRTWRVRILRYSNVDMTPDDKEVVTFNVDWINVPGRNISYNFTEHLNN